MLFEGRTLAIATIHHKEKVIAPLFEKALRVKCTVSPHLNTDLFGTFTGEIERKSNALETARKKCHLALAISNCDLAIASEGSFGPHPMIPFLTADEEILLLMDNKNGFEITVKELSVETNFFGAEISTEKELLEIAERCHFPSHALILRKSKTDFKGMVKGINNHALLLESFHHLISAYGEAYVETDMRALFNPSRMKVIEKAAIALIEKINSKCPQCGTPGFDISTIKSGLPCEQCNFPTQSAISHTYQCLNCSYTEEKMFPREKKFEDPMYCDFCNP